MQPRHACACVALWSGFVGPSHPDLLQAEKTVNFTAAPAMAVRLTCLTEAGGRGPWTSAAEINILGTPQTPADPATIGEWGPLIDFPLVPVAAASLPGSKVRSTPCIACFVRRQLPQDALSVTANPTWACVYRHNCVPSARPLGRHQLLLPRQTRTASGLPLVVHYCQCLPELYWCRATARDLCNQQCMQRLHWQVPCGRQQAPMSAAGLQVLTWSAYGEDRFGVGDLGQTVTATLDAGSGTVTQAVVTNTMHDMFCPGISMLGNGDIVVTGASQHAFGMLADCLPARA